MGVVNKINPVKVYDSQIRGSSFQFVDVYDFLKIIRVNGQSAGSSWNAYINFLFFLIDFLVGTNQVKNFESIDEVVDFPHEAFHENDLWQANAEISQFRWEGLKLAEVVELHGGGEIEEHVSEVRTLCWELVEDGVGD